MTFNENLENKSNKMLFSIKRFIREIGKYLARKHILFHNGTSF